MHLRSYHDDDLATLLDLAIATFGPFMDDYRAHVGDRIFTLERDDWRGAYARQLPTLHDPDAGKRLVLAEEDGAVLGFVAWEVDDAKHHGTIELLAVAREHRGKQVATTLCQHAMADLRERGARTVDVGTGGDAFHAPARACYESLGFTPVVIVHYVREL